MVFIFENIIQQERIKKNEPMAEHTTFRAGGAADFFLTPDNAKEMASLIETCCKNKLPWYVLGNGSNVLVKDEGFHGVVISTKNLNSIELIDEYRIYAECGAVLSKVANFALDNDLSGLEFASGIPGTVGGAVFMNAGAYNREIKNSFESAEILDVDKKTNEFSTIIMNNDEMEFSYRYSVLQKSGAINLSAVLCLVKSNYVEIKDHMIEINRKRAEKQPLDLPSAGSAFKRPLDNFAGKLIMEAGLSGYSIGGAQISEKHCGFIVNRGNATANDILGVVDHVQDVVFEKFGVALEPEFRIIG